MSIHELYISRASSASYLILQFDVIVVALEYSADAIPCLERFSAEFPLRLCLPLEACYPACHVSVVLLPYACALEAQIFSFQATCDEVAIIEK